jgi:hypothetical protein
LCWFEQCDFKAENREKDEGKASVGIEESRERQEHVNISDFPIVCAMSVRGNVLPLSRITCHRFF